ncbi:MAG TPA: hypothetical protein VHP33_06870 [Polyangiaceae bacterium]|nr:hypothetical protein [Polyangiaceae bacterium]
MARETRKLKRAQSTAPSAGKAAREAGKPGIQRGQMADPLGQGQLRALLMRLGLIVVGIWILFGSIAMFVDSPWNKVLLGVPVLLTGAGVAVLIWTLRQAKTARGVASILSNVSNDEERKAALEKLSTDFKKGDTAAVFARAQLELQEDPKKALATLESIDLGKVMAPVADEARGQRAMIHLTQGEVSQARQLVDNIDLSRHNDPRTRAMLASVVAEAWARSGDAKKALETLSLFDFEESTFEQIRPQLYRAQAYAAAQTSDMNTMRRALRKLLAVDVRLLGGFMTKKTHPLLQKEAKKILEQSGQVPKKMIVQRRV